MRVKDSLTTFWTCVDSYDNFIFTFKRYFCFRRVRFSMHYKVLVLTSDERHRTILALLLLFYARI